MNDKKETMTWGFIMLRHVCNKITDLYWKESYRCIRKVYPTVPVLIVDDSSNRDFLNEDLVTTNCEVIYDTDNKGRAELLPYYYFHKLHPFDDAVIIHDSVFIQREVDFSLQPDENVRFLWTFGHQFDHDITHLITDLCIKLPNPGDLLHFFHLCKSEWIGCFGVMSVIRWSFLDDTDRRYGGLFRRWLPAVKSRENRHALERAFPLIIGREHQRSVLGDIFGYIRWGVTFTEYLNGDFSQYPVMKVWTSR